MFRLIVFPDTTTNGPKSSARLKRGLHPRNAEIQASAFMFDCKKSRIGKPKHDRLFLASVLQSPPHMPLRFLAILTLAILTLPSLASAQEAPGVHPAMVQPVAAEVPASSQVENYGWQIGLLDTTALVMVLVGAQSDEGGVAVLGAGTYLLSGPTVHLMRGHTGRALGSLALRVALPVIGAELATSGYSCNTAVEDECGSEGVGRIILGGMAGVLAAGAVDWFLLGKEERKAGSLGIQPTLSPTRGGGGQVGLMGVF